MSKSSPKKKSRKPATIREDLLIGLKNLKSVKDGRPIHILTDEAVQQYLSRRGFYPLPDSSPDS